jgi:hypothetical protein
MVVQASIEGFGRGAQGQFGKDDPWPDWANKSDLVMEGLLKDDSGSQP